MRFDLPVAACPTCGGFLTAFSQPVHEGKAFSQPLSYDLCRSCGLVVMNPQPTQEAIDEFYRVEYRQLYEGASGPVASGLARQQERADRLAALVERPARHLDIGASSGTLLATVGAEERVGVEPGDGHRAAAIEAGITMYRSIDEVTGTFDLITMSHVLEHIADPVGFLRQVRERCSGRFLVEVPNHYSARTYEVAHLLSFTRESLTATLGRAGFAVERVVLDGKPADGFAGPQNLAMVAHPAEISTTVTAPHPTVMHVRRAFGYGPQVARIRYRRLVRKVRRRLPSRS